MGNKWAGMARSIGYGLIDLCKNVAFYTELDGNLLMDQTQLFKAFYSELSE